MTEDKSNFYSGHFLDTAENYKLIWYGKATLVGIKGITSLVVSTAPAAQLYLFVRVKV